MSQETSPVAGVCKVCGQPLGAVAQEHTVCHCTKCQTPAHPDCFAYSGGCAVYGCGSLAARFGHKPPEGWREEADGSWSVPATAVGAPRRSMDALLERFVSHWRTTAQLELFVALGQAWFASVTLVMTLLGKWTLPLTLLCAVALVVLAHANTLIGLVRVGMTLTAGEDEDPAAAPRRALGTRAGTIARSRMLHLLATVLLFVGLAVGGHIAPSYVQVVVIFVALVPWFSLNPRWGLERLLLQTAQQRLSAGQ